MISHVWLTQLHLAAIKATSSLDHNGPTDAPCERSLRPSPGIPIAAVLSQTSHDPWNILKPWKYLWNLMASYGILWHLMASYGIYGSNLWYVHCTQFVHVLFVDLCSIYLQRALEDAVCIYHIDPYRMIPSTCRTEWNIMLSPQCNGCNGCNAVLCDCTSICFWPGRAALWDNPLEEKMEKEETIGNHGFVVSCFKFVRQLHPSRKGKSNLIQSSMQHWLIVRLQVSLCLFRLQVLLN